MTASRTARDRARTELTAEITAAARRQLAAAGAQHLSLRAVARELGMVSSALYRYFPSRDDLLTALIVDAFTALAAHLEAADRALPHTAVRERWTAVCRSAREWAREHPHEYALIFGSPVPGYHAPQQTVAPARRVALVPVRVLRDACVQGVLAPVPDDPALPPALAVEVGRLAAELAPEVPPALLTRGIVAWTQLFGMISFELFGHLVNTVEGPELFEQAAELMADFLGLPHP